MTTNSALNFPQLSTGQTYIGTASGIPVPGNITGGNGCVVTSTANSINISNQGDSLSTNLLVNPTPANISANQKYINLSILQSHFVLPPDGVSRVGDVITIIDSFNSAGWKVTFGSVGQIIGFVNKSTSPSGSIVGPANTNACVTLILARANPDFWVAYSTTGNIVVT